MCKTGSEMPPPAVSFYFLLNSERLTLDLLLIVAPLVDICGRILRWGKKGDTRISLPQKFLHHYKVSGKPTDCQAPDLLELNLTFGGHSLLKLPSS